MSTAGCMRVSTSGPTCAPEQGRRTKYSFQTGQVGPSRSSLMDVRGGSTKACRTCKLGLRRRLDLFRGASPRTCPRAPRASGQAAGKGPGHRHVCPLSSASTYSRTTHSSLSLPQCLSLTRDASQNNSDVSRSTSYYRPGAAGVESGLLEGRSGLAGLPRGGKRAHAKPMESWSWKGDGDIRRRVIAKAKAHMRLQWTVVNTIGLANTAAWTSPNMLSSDPPSSRNRSRSYCSIANGTETPFGYRWSDSIFGPYFKVCPNTAAGLTRSPVRSAGAGGRGHEETHGRAKIQ